MVRRLQRILEDPVKVLLGYLTTVTQGMGEGPMTPKNMVVKVQDSSYFWTEYCTLSCEEPLRTRSILCSTLACDRRSGRSHIISLCEQLCWALNAPGSQAQKGVPGRGEFLG